MKQNTNQRNLIIWSSLLLGLLFISIVAPLLTQIDPTATNLTKVFAPPSSKNFLGTDSMGRDLLTRLLYGGRISLTVAILSVLISTSLGIFFGGISGYFGGWLDQLLMRLLDTILAIPNLIIILALQTLIHGGILSLIIIIGSTTWMSMARIVRGEFQALKEQEFVKAAQILHTPAWKIFWFNLLLNSLTSIILIAIFNAAQAIFIETSLSFLGLGVPPEIPTWGNMLNNAQSDLLSGAWWIWLFPGLMTILSLLAINFLGESLKQYLIFNPKYQEE